jgi:GNAT superfamily N-acetyltransferase
MRHPQATVRLATPADLDWAIAQAAREGWNPGLHDAAAFLAQDPQGFLVAELEGRPVGCISAVRYDGNFAFSGFYIVVPELRGQGLGVDLAGAALTRLAGFTVGLDGVVQQQENYRRAGFVWQYANLRFGFANPGFPRAPSHPFVPATQVPFADLLALDTACFGFPRPRFLRAWLDLPDAFALAAPGGADDGALGVIRRCREGWKVGPLFASDPAQADALFRQLCARVPTGDRVYLDVPQPNAAALALAASHGLTKVFETARMYLGPVPALPLDRIFGVTTFELG